MSQFSTKDLELSEKLQAEGCVVTKITTDPLDRLVIHTFEESESEINKILGVKPEKVAEEKAEVLPEVTTSVEVKKKKAGRPKKRRR